MISINKKYYRGKMENDELVVFEWNYIDGEHIKTEIVRLGNNNYEGMKKVFKSETSQIIFSANLVSIEHYIREHENLPLPKRFEKTSFGEVEEIFAFVEKTEEHPNKWSCYYYENYRERKKKYYALINDGEEIPEPFLFQ